MKASTMQKLQQRAERMARSDANRAEVYEFLRKRGRPLLIDAAEEGRVPASSVSSALIDMFGKSIMTAPMMRQFCGLACAAILSEEGFEVDQTGVRVAKDPLFSFGATYRRRSATATETSSLITRIIDTLDEVELREAEALIRARLQALQ
jgi:hypothetical protein